MGTTVWLSVQHEDWDYRNNLIHLTHGEVPIKNRLQSTSVSIINVSDFTGVVVTVRKLPKQTILWEGEGEGGLRRVKYLIEKKAQETIIKC